MVPITAALTLLQLLLVWTWTLYAAFLPQLLASAGLDKSWVPLILLVDQVLFLVLDPLMGFFTDLVGPWLRRLGPVLLLVSLLSAGCFAILPLVSGLGSLALLVPLFCWAASSTALRAPMMVLLHRHVPQPRAPGPLVLALVGMGIGSALSPSLTTALADWKPLIPFLLASASTVAGVLVLLVAEALAPPADTSPRGAWTLPRLLILGLLVFGLGLATTAMQLHTGLRQGAILKAGLRAGLLPWVQPLFGIGMAGAMVLWRPLLGGLFPWVGMALGALAFGLSAGLSAVSSLEAVLVGTTLLSGAAWGGLFSSGIGAALSTAPERRAGLALGLFFSTLAAGSVIRLTGVTTTLWAAMPPVAMDLLVVGLACLSAVFLALGGWMVWLRPTLTKP